MEPLLTIAVPTYNRAPYLRRLLDVLATMTVDLADRVELIVSDNASGDGTDAVIANFARRCPAARTICNSTNVGADANIEQCFRLARGEYVWILGDDDMPKAGAIDAVMAVLVGQRPDILYMPSEWLPNVTDPQQGSSYHPADWEACDRLRFARRVNVWLTFLSGIVVRKAHAAGVDFAPLYRSHLIQLGWILPALHHGDRFCAFKDPLVLATAGNTGGYAVVKVFGANLPDMVAQEFGHGSPVHRAVVGRTIASYLPQLIWNVRTGSDGCFAVDLPWADLRQKIGRFPAFWSFVVPVGRAPEPIARGALLAARAFSKLDRMLRG